MTFQLTVLGGSAAWPNPGQGCSSYLLTAGDQRLLLDCGTNTLLELRRHACLTDIDAIIISHCHSDHILDLIAYRYALVYSTSNPASRIPIWLPPRGTGTLRVLGEILGSQGERTTDFWNDVFTLAEYDPDQPLEFGHVTFNFAKTQHFTDCYAMRARAASGQSIVYGADTGNIESLVAFANDANLLISEATADDLEGVPEDERGHITPEAAGEWAARSNVERLLITHLWCERSESEVVERARSRFNGPIDVAQRGLTLYV